MMEIILTALLFVFAGGLCEEMPNEDIGVEVDYDFIPDIDHYIEAHANDTPSISSEGRKPNDFDENVIFYGFKDTYQNRFISSFNTPVKDQGCYESGNFAVIVHGWKEDVDTPWGKDLVQNLLQHRGGCIFFMDYSKYSKVQNYLELLPKFKGLSEVLASKFKQIGNYDRQFCFGFSFGARLCVEAGTIIGSQVIDRMDLCELAGPGFEPPFFWLSIQVRDPKKAATNVQCINTSSDKGSTVYNCHQNFRMGQCGMSQPASGPYPLGSHGLCPYFYNSAFDNVFAPTKNMNCISSNLAQTRENTRMGYLGVHHGIQGEIFIQTGRYPPYVAN